MSKRTRFSKIIIVGTNKIACDCLSSLISKVEKECIIVLETSFSKISLVKNTCYRFGVQYVCYYEVDEITAFLDKNTDSERILIISASNRYIFKPALIEKTNVDIINFHYSLLPQYRGVNIPSWVIYNGESKTGITWHFVTEMIDHGKILSQKEIPITLQTTAFDIVKHGMRLAKNAFDEFIEELLDHQIDGIKVDYPENGRIYYSKELPGNGYLDLDAEIVVIGRLLRAYDYRGISRFPKLKTSFNGNLYEIEKYKSTTIESVGKDKLIIETSQGIEIRQGDMMYFVMIREMAYT